MTTVQKMLARVSSERDLIIALLNTVRYCLSEVCKRGGYCSWWWEGVGEGVGLTYLKERHCNRIYVSASLWKM